MASNEINPVEIARETLKRLAAGNIAPTPWNYQACYHEIAQLPLKTPFPAAQMKSLVARLSAIHSLPAALLDALELAVAQQQWLEVEKALVGILTDRLTVAQNTSAQGAWLPGPVWRDLANIIDCLLPALGDIDAESRCTGKTLVQALKQPEHNAAELQALLRDAPRQFRLAADEQEQMRQSLSSLMRLLLENIRLLTPEEGWLRGQVEGLLAAMQTPLRLRNLDEMERRLREVIQHQEIAHRQSLEARDEMKHLLTTFITSLARINDHSSEFQKEIEQCVDEVKGVKSVDELEPLLCHVIDATRKMSEDASQAHTQLTMMQEKVVATERALVQLYEELDHASMLARHDPLTETLNRKGLEEALGREIARCRRQKSPLSLALLDIDDFKRINDRLGHDTGDKALVHLANVARQCMRPSDVLARYGGEEFVILMPDTPIENGIEVMVRLQR